MMACEELPRFIAPMLARTAPLPIAPDAPWVLEVKWDGVCAQIRAERGQLTLRTRPGRDATSEFPDAAGYAEVMQDLPTLSGEFVQSDGVVITRGGEDFWKVGSVASGFSGDAGRRRLGILVQTVIPKPSDALVL
jgi:ATP-dependent DNA ligase